MGKIIRITPSNVEECEAALHDLRAHLDELARRTKGYPVECQFASYRFVFENRADIESVIEKLDAKIRAYRSAA
jgi:hypothetical protein